MHGCTQVTIKHRNKMSFDEYQISSQKTNLNIFIIFNLL